MNRDTVVQSITSRFSITLSLIARASKPYAVPVARAHAPASSATRAASQFPVSSNCGARRNVRVTRRSLVMVGRPVASDLVGDSAPRRRRVFVTETIVGATSSRGFLALPVTFLTSLLLPSVPTAR